MTQELKTEDDLFVTVGVAGMFGFTFQAEHFKIEEAAQDAKSFIELKPGEGFDEFVNQMSAISYLRHFKVTIASRVCSSLNVSCVVVNDEFFFDRYTDDLIIWEIV